jgi:DNA polymerase
MSKYKNPAKPGNHSELEDFDWFDPNPPQPPPYRPPQPITLWDLAFMTGTTKETHYDRCKRFILPLSTANSACTMCELGRKEACKNDELRDPHVFSNRNPKRFMVVGQNPGWNEVCQGTPFIGAAGGEFDTALAKFGGSRDDFYITNIVKCFTKDNAKPSRESQEACSPWLQMEINIINPILVVTLGAVSFNYMCPSAKYSDSLRQITKSERYGVKVFAMYHPSPLNLNSGGKRGDFEAQVKVLCALIRKMNKQ